MILVERGSLLSIKNKIGILLYRCYFDLLLCYYYFMMILNLHFDLYLKENEHYSY